jgi:hypothetical protein
VTTLTRLQMTWCCFISDVVVLSIIIILALMASRTSQ